MALTLEQEKRFILLLSVQDLGGAGTKQQVLDNIEKQGYFTFDDDDLSLRKSRSELVWRNDLAYIREHLVKEGYLDSSQRNCWKITPNGHAYLQKLHHLITSSHQTNFQKLTQKAIIRASITNQDLDIETQVIIDLQALETEEEHFEGSQQTRYSNYYERDQKLRAKAIRIHGTTCMACGFSFEKGYGKHGKGFIEVHHIKPVSQLGSKTKVNPKTDLSVVCSNCHRMIHRKKNEILSLSELKKIIQCSYLE